MAQPIDLPEEPCLPVLYTFRRCPYAMRARMAIAKAGITVELREVVLRDKPRALIEASAKATVPVLLLPDGSVIDESYDILLWAFGLSDPDNWLPNIRAELAEMVVRNDGEFKQNLDGYKYSHRHSEKTRDEYRDAGAKWLAVLDDRMRASEFLCGNSPTALDIAIMPFIRQFANTDLKWFEASPYRSLGRWLNFWVNSELFLSVMHKYPQWQPGDPSEFFPI
jgi:glutathione S-transferase